MPSAKKGKTYEKTGTVMAGTAVRGHAALTPNQLVAWNLTRARQLRGWTQEEAAERLEPHLGERWSRATMSMAERSIDGSRIRRFDADDLLALSQAFDLPITYFLVPPPWVSDIAPANSDEKTPVGGYMDRVFDIGESAPQWLVREAVPMTAQTTRALRCWGSHFAAMVAHREQEVAALVELIPATESDTTQPLTYSQGDVQRRGSDGEPLEEGES